MYHDGVWSIVLVCSFLLVACGTPTVPTVGPGAPTSVRPAPADPTTTTGEPQSVRAPATLPAGMAATYTAQVAQESTEEARLLATPTPEPVLTPVAHGVLLREVWQQQGLAAGNTPTFLYALDPQAAGEHTFWRAGLDTLTQPEQLTGESQPGRHLTSSISSDGRWFAYTLGPVDQIRLHVMRTDGSEMRLLADGWKSFDDRYAWSPVGNRLLYSEYERNSADVSGVEVLYLYDADQNSDPQRIATRPNTYLIGWLDAQRVLLYSFSHEFPLRFEILHIDTGAIQSLVTMPEQLQGTTRWSLAPDRQHLLLRTRTNAWALLDLTSATFRDLDSSPGSMVWAPDSQHVLAFSRRGGETATLVPVLTDSAPITVAVTLPYKPSTSFSLIGLAPDGSALVVDEYTHARRIPYARTRVYDVWNDRWYTLAERPDWATFLGWIPQEEQP